MSKANKQCPVDGCTKLTNGCGLCHMHYWRLRQYGDVKHTKLFVRKKCAIEDCENYSRKRGWCQKHYSRWLKRGDPNIVKFTQEKHGMVHTPEYQTWRGMKERCYTPTCQSYRFYGARGIKVCERWRRSFKAFYSDMSPRPKDLTLDRINASGNYSCGKCPECLANGWPANCEWATHKRQVLNRNIYSNNTSGYRGVSKVRTGWTAYITCDRKRYTLGTFRSKDEAAQAYNAAALKYHGADANLNDVKSAGIE